MAPAPAIKTRTIRAQQLTTWHQLVDVTDSGRRKTHTMCEITQTDGRVAVVLAGSWTRREYKPRDQVLVNRKLLASTIKRRR